jgi:hypothetical protein
MNRSCKPWLIHVCQSAVTNIAVSMSCIVVVKHILPLAPWESQSSTLLGTTNCRIVSAASLVRTIRTFFFVVGLVLVCGLLSAPITGTVFASYDVLMGLVMVLHVKTGSRRLQFWEVIAKVSTVHQ